MRDVVSAHALQPTLEGEVEPGGYSATSGTRQGLVKAGATGSPRHPLNHILAMPLERFLEDEGEP